MIGIDMNERIEELARQCMSMRFFVDTASEEFDYKKFAELIVRECASLMESEKDYYSKPGSYESREYYERMAAKEDAFDDAAHMIKSHFGVE
jgi:hypothetical protein